MINVDYEEIYRFEKMAGSKVCPADEAADIWPPHSAAKTSMESLMSGDEIPDRSQGTLQFLWGGGSDSKLDPIEHPVGDNLFGRTAMEAFEEAFSGLPSSTSRSSEPSSTHSTPVLLSDKTLPDVQLGPAIPGPVSPTSPEPPETASESNHSEYSIPTGAMPLTVVADSIETQQLAEDMESLPSRMESTIVFSEPTESVISISDAVPRTIKKKPGLRKKVTSVSRHHPEITGGKIKNLFDVPRQRNPRSKKRQPSYNEDDEEFDVNGSSAEASGSQSLGQYKCPYQWCGKRFTRKNDVKRHLQNAAVHKADVPQDAWSPTRCRKCHAELSRVDACKRHEARDACWKRTLPSKKQHINQREGKA